jgi:hypothetical protein
MEYYLNHKNLSEERINVSAYLKFQSFRLIATTNHQATSPPPYHRQWQNRHEARPALSITVMHQTNKYHQLYMTTQLYNMLAQSYNTQETKLNFEHYVIIRRIIDNT